MSAVSLKGKPKWALIVIVFAVMAASWSGYIDRKTEAYVDKATIQALAAFATARFLNRVLTTAASVEVEASVGLGSVSVRPGEVLDPVHDLVEQYSSVMKLASASLITQKLLLGIVSADFFKLLLTLLGVLLVASLFIQEGRYSGTLLKLFALAGLIRFLFVLTIAANALVDQAYVNQETERNMSAVQATASDIEILDLGSNLSTDERDELTSRLTGLAEQRASLADQIGTRQPALRRAQEKVQEARGALAAIEGGLSVFERNNPFTKNPGLIDARSNLRALEHEASVLTEGLRAAESSLEDIDEVTEEINSTLEGRRKPNWFTDMASKAKSMIDMARLERLWDSVVNIVPNILNLMALFVFKTLIMPVVFLMLLLRGFRYIWSTDLRDTVRAELANIRAELRMRDATERNKGSAVQPMNT